MSGLYVHIPFCRNRCGYCGFYSGTDYSLAEIYFEALCAELCRIKSKKFDTLYIGGGTPSSVPLFLLKKLFKNLEWFSFSESTIEANPESLSEDFLYLIKDCGFSRISVGCQSTDNDVLEKLGRIHSASDIFAGSDRIRRIIPDAALNLDMIFDIPFTETKSAEKTLEDIISIFPEHVSAYSYSFDTPLFDAEDASDASLFSAVKHRLGDAGYRKYEISNFALPKNESRHNINYWKLGDYTGIGASAWSLENTKGRRVLRGKAADVKSYCDSPFSFASEEISEGCTLVFEDVVFGLRMLDGVDFSVLKYKYGQKSAGYLAQPVKVLCDEGFTEWKSSVLCLTEKGELLLDSVQEYLWGFLP